MRVAVAATPEVAIPTLNYLLTSEHELVFVLTRPDKPSGRGKGIHQSPVSEWASDHSINIYKPTNPTDLVTLFSLVDLVITIGYGVILPEELLRQPTFGFVNVHFSLLPAWRGAAPVQRAIENGDRRSGITIFALDKGMDTGPIYIKSDTEIGDEESSGELLARMAAMTPAALALTFRDIENGVEPVPQSAIGATHARKLTRDECHINWNESADSIFRKIRAFSPKPGAWTTWRGSTLEMLKANPYLSSSPLGVGEIHRFEKDVIIGCGHDSALKLERIKVAGKREMSAQEWANGARFMSGEKFE